MLLDLGECHKQYHGMAKPKREMYIDDIIPDGIQYTHIQPTEFRGRATQIHVFPLSFEEFYSHVGGDERKALDTYMLYGGMPRLLALTDEKDKKDYLSSLYSQLYVKDILERNGIEREDILNDILDFPASQISSLTNPTNIANAAESFDENDRCGSIPNTRQSVSWEGISMQNEKKKPPQNPPRSLFAEAPLHTITIF